MNIKLLLSIIRWPNILIVVLTQYLCRHFILKPVLKLNKLGFFVDEFDFFLLVFATAIIAIAGYLINDYFDLQADIANNKPLKTAFVKKNRKLLLWLHHSFSAVGVLIGFYLGFKVGSLNPGFVFFLVVSLLWYYSVSYKKKIIVGNLVIAFLSALVILIVWLLDFYAFKQSAVQLRFNNWFVELILGYVIFAFLFSFLREILKDIEDIEGDKLTHVNTFAVKYGLKNAKILVFALLVPILIFIAKAEFWLYQLELNVLFYYFLFFINLLFLAFLWFFIVAKSKKGFRRAQQITKLIMLAGILSMFFLPAYAEKFI